MGVKRASRSINKASRMNQRGVRNRVLECIKLASRGIRKGIRGTKAASKRHHRSTD